jgi:hypothetical protein
LFRGPHKLTKTSVNNRKNHMQQAAIKVVSLATISDLLEQSETLQMVDTGASLVTTLSHPQLGFLTVITNAMDENGVALVDRQNEHLIAM